MSGLGGFFAEHGPGHESLVYIFSNFFRLKASFFSFEKANNSSFCRNNFRNISNDDWHVKRRFTHIKRHFAFRTHFRTETIIWRFRSSFFVTTLLHSFHIAFGKYFFSRENIILWLSEIPVPKYVFMKLVQRFVLIMSIVVWLCYSNHVSSQITFFTKKSSIK